MWYQHFIIYFNRNNNFVSCDQETIGLSSPFQFVQSTPTKTTKNLHFICEQMASPDLHSETWFWFQAVPDLFSVLHYSNLFNFLSPLARWLKVYPSLGIWWKKSSFRMIYLMFTLLIKWKAIIYRSWSPCTNQLKRSMINELTNIKYIIKGGN